MEAYELPVRGASVIGFQMRMLAFGKPARYARRLREVWEMRDAGALRVSVYEEIPPTEAARAHALIEDRSNLGKAVLVL
ncbi:zinc-binding dehydrogenase [Streptomyces sp. NPDC046557]|uniref:zinc-binding dehydrogenase n=1 Tax=Streptomyces sp. NPDC046557 TaxID=3155372 RepID=UPI0033FFB298